jgi:hypothetical protein
MSKTLSLKKLQEQITTHVKDAMGDFPTPHLLEWHTDIFLSIIAKQTEEAYKQGYIAGGIDQLTKENK